MLNVHVVDAERLASVVQRPGARPIGIGQWIALRQEVPMLVDRPEGFVTDFMINDHEFTEVRTRAIFNHHLPATFCLCSRTGSQRLPVLGIPWFHNEGTGET